MTRIEGLNFEFCHLIDIYPDLLARKILCRKADDVNENFVKMLSPFF